MPCTDGGPSGPSLYDETKSKLDLATRLLCNLVKDVPAKYLKDPELVSWIQKHELEDKARLEREQRIQKIQDEKDLLEFEHLRKKLKEKKLIK